MRCLPQFANFHDMLKARLLPLRQPIQIIRRSTWDETAPPPAGRSRQDEASRAWNLHVALYYKAGGVPWRLPRNSADLTTCYVGVAVLPQQRRRHPGHLGRPGLQRSAATASSSAAARPGSAATTASPTSPNDDAHALLLAALDAYRREHRTLPARVVLHKTSSFTAAEIDGFQAPPTNGSSTPSR